MHHHIEPQDRDTRAWLPRHFVWRPLSSGARRQEGWELVAGNTQVALVQQTIQRDKWLVVVNRHIDSEKPRPSAHYFSLAAALHHTERWAAANQKRLPGP